VRTTIDLDPVVLATLKQRQQRDGKTLSVLVSELLAKALAQESSGVDISVSWPAAALGARIDIDDRDALWAVLDQH
jgi:hypothetical protein